LPWVDDDVPDNGDTAIFEGGSTAKLYAHQDKAVTLKFQSGTATLLLNGFNFSYEGIEVGKPTFAFPAGAEIVGQGRLLNAAAAPGPSIVVGAGNAEADIAFVNLDDIEFHQMLIGANGAPGTARIQNSTAYGRDIVVGRFEIGPGVEVSDLTVTASQVALSNDLTIGWRGEANATIESSVVRAAHRVWVGAGGNPGQPITDAANGALTIRASEVVGGEMWIGTNSTGTVQIEGQSAVDVSGATIVGHLSKADDSEDNLTVKDSDTALRTGSLVVAYGGSSHGNVTLESGGIVRVEGVAIIGNAGDGNVDVDGGGPGAGGQTTLNAGHIRIGEFGNGAGTLSVSNTGQVVVSSERRANPVEPSMFVGIGGKGTLLVEVSSDVAIEANLAIGEWTHTAAPAEVTVLNSEVIVENNITNNERRSKVSVEGENAILRGKNKEFGKTGAMELNVNEGAIAEGTDGVEIGGGDEESTVGVYTGGVLRSNLSVVFQGPTTVHGDSSVAADEAINTDNETVVVAPGSEEGGTAVLTFDTPDFSATQGMTLAIDAVADGWPSAEATSDRLHVTGTANVGGSVALALGFTPVPWTSDGTAGSWTRVLSADEGLSGEMSGSCPDPNSLGLPSLPPKHHYEWKVIHDRDDSTPYGLLAALHSNFYSQPWLGNGTMDVVLVIMEIPPPDGSDDAYETPEDQTLEQTTDGVLDNDIYLGGGGLIPVLIDPPGNGTLTLNPDGTFIYVPYAGFSGTDSFTYRPVSGDYEGDETTVTITVVHDPCQPPVAMDDGFNGNIDTPLSEPAPGVLWNDSGVGTFWVELAADVSSGTLSLSSDGSFLYTPNPGWWGIDYFTYVVTDGVCTSNVATVELDIIPYPPLALDQPAAPGPADALSMQALLVMSDAAIARWRAAGVDDEALADQLAGLRYEIRDLPGSLLGGALPDGTVLIDIDAAGYGWYVDATPRTDREFDRIVSSSQREATSGEAATRADLLTVVMHEIGHFLGLDHAYFQRTGDATNLMNDSIGLGVRRTPTAWEAAIVDYLYWTNRRR
jgi:hypothetical protein